MNDLCAYTYIRLCIQAQKTTKSLSCALLNHLLEPESQSKQENRRYPVLFYNFDFILYTLAKYYY